MINQLLQLYPNAILSKRPNTDPGLIWFKEEESVMCIGIPNIELTKRERKLLETLFPLGSLESHDTLPLSTRLWRDFLLFDGALPSIQEVNCRFIHFSISNIREEFQFEEWEEALNSLFPHEIIIVPFNKLEGVIIETQTDVQMAEDDLLSAIEAFESDFFFKAHFYIGRYNIPDNGLKQQFNLEQSLFKLSLTEQPEVRISTIEKLIPLYVFQSIPADKRYVIFNKIHNVFAEDREFSETIKLYIENQSNATLTAKQLFMHRNSLQYRIDKFIEKTGVDIKTFHGAFLAYLACLYLNND